MNIAQRLNHIKEQITLSCKQYGRNPLDVLLLAVSKNRTSDEISQAYAAGQIDFGENYAQEALLKMNTLKNLPLIWHFIGSIQSNKTKMIAENFDWVHSVSRFEIAKKLSQYRSVNKLPLNICIQVNISDEKSKSGVKVTEVLPLIKLIKQLPRLNCRGLMVIPQETNDFKQQRVLFANIARVKDEFNQQGFMLDTLSMGMSNDYVAAIAEGATIIRIGTAIFGKRNTK